MDTLLGDIGVTHKDISSARLYVNYRLLLNTRNTCLREAPHIFSHTVLKIEAVNDDRGDYIYEKHFANRAIKVQWSFNETGCSTTSCFPTYPLSETCKKDSATFSFGLPGGNRMDACQPACYNSKIVNANITIDKDSKQNKHRVPPQLIWFEDSCLMENYALTSFFVDPSKHHDNGKNDVTGFDIYITKVGADNTPITCARINPQYCQSFYVDFIKDYDEESLQNDKACGYDGANYYLQLFIGSSLIKFVRLSADVLNMGIEKFKREILEGGRFEKEVPEFLQHHKPTKDFLSSLKSWKNNINRSKKIIPDEITLSDLGFENERAKDRLIWTDEFSHIDDGRNDIYGGRLIEKTRDIPVSVSNGGDENIVPKKIVDEILIPAGKRVARHLNDEKNAFKFSDNKLLDIMQKVMFGIGGMLSEENLQETSLQLGTDGGTAIFKHFLNKLGPRVVNAFLKSELLAAGKTISSKLLSTVISHAMINLIVENVALQFGRAAIALMGVASTALTVIGWIMLIGSILDLLFAFVWDPFEFSTPTLSDSLLRKISESALMHRQVEFGSRRIEMTPYIFWVLHVAGDNRKYENDHALCGLKHTLFYFSNRKISSDGSNIDWYTNDNNDLITISNGTKDDDIDGNQNTTDVRTVFRQLIVRNMMIGFEDVHFYQYDMNKRANFANYMVGCTVVGILPVMCITLDKRNYIYGILVIFLVLINFLTIWSYNRVFFNYGTTKNRYKSLLFSKF